MQRRLPTLPLPALLLAGLLLLGGLPPWPAPCAAAGPEAERFDDSMYPVEFRLRVNQAIQRGAASLKAAQQPDGSFQGGGRYALGRTALWALTLLRCGVPPDDPQMQRAFRFLRAQPLTETYSVAVLLMALEARYAPAEDPFAAPKHDRYGKASRDTPCAQAMTREDRAWMREAVAWLAKQQRADGAWRYPAGGRDLSNTQFALLGLHAATRCGGDVRRAVWLDALEGVLAWQEATGEPIEYRANEVRGRYRFEWVERALARGFAYQPGRKVSGSMTTAGLTALVICQDRLWTSRAFTGRLRTATRRGVRDAMAWLQHNFTVLTNPGGSPWWTFYYLYGLERCGVLGRFRFLGQHDWYREGAEEILRLRVVEQKNASACFGLLFLKRATSRMKAPVITPGGRPDQAPEPLSPAERPHWATPDGDVPKPHLLAVGYWVKRLASPDPQVVFRATIRLAALRDRLAVKPLAQTLASHGDPYARVGAAVALSRLEACNAVEALVDALGDPEDLVRHAANQALARITGNAALRYLSAMGASDRMRLKAAWRTWWKEHEAEVRQRLRQPHRGG